MKVNWPKNLIWSTFFHSKAMADVPWPESLICLFLFFRIELAKLATKGEFLVAKVKVLVALATVLVPILSPELRTRTPGDLACLTGFYTVSHKHCRLDNVIFIQHVISLTMEWHWRHLCMNDPTGRYRGHWFNSLTGTLKIWKSFLHFLHPLPSDYHLYHSRTGAFNAIPSFICVMLNENHMVAPTMLEGTLCVKKNPVM